MKLVGLCRSVLRKAGCTREPIYRGSCARLSATFASQGQREQNVNNAGTFNMRPETCYYKALNLETGAKNQEIKLAFQKLVKRYHPDVNPDPKAIEIYKKVTEAYDVLADPDKRRIYDESIGATDEFFTDDYATANPNRRMWNYRHQQILEEELRRAAENPSEWKRGVELDEFLENSTKAVDRALLEAKRDLEKARIKAKEAELPYIIDGQKQDPEQMYQYFKSKYIKNPDIETRDPDEQLDFSWKLHNKTKMRVAEGRKNYYEFVAGSDIGSFYVEKNQEDHIDSPMKSALGQSKGFLLATVAVMGGLWWFLTSSHQSAAHDVVGSKKVSRGEGITQKVVPI